MARRWVILIAAAMIAFAAIVAVGYLTPTRDGSGPERAVVLHVPEDKVTDAEWAWWQKVYPDAGFVMHSMESHSGRIYSHYLLGSPNGRREIWFATDMRDE